MVESAKTGTIFDSLEQLGSGSSYESEISDMLERADMFRDFSRADVEKLASIIQAYKAPVGTKVLVEGGRDAYMFVLIEGRVDILKRDAAGSSDKKIATVRSGKTIGEMSMIDSLPSSATAVVVEPAKLLLITRRNFDNFTDSHPETGLKVLRKIASLMSLRLRQTSGVLMDYLQNE